MRRELSLRDAYRLIDAHSEQIEVLQATVEELVGRTNMIEEDMGFLGRRPNLFQIHPFLESLRDLGLTPPKEALS